MYINQVWNYSDFLNYSLFRIYIKPKKIVFFFIANQVKVILKTQLEAQAQLVLKLFLFAFYPVLID
jgi:hypothetical protein